MFSAEIYASIPSLTDVMEIHFSIAKAFAWSTCFCSALSPAWDTISNALKNLHSRTPGVTASQAKVYLYMRITALLLSIVPGILAANAPVVSADQAQYIQKYKNQKLIPAPAEMLINMEAEPDLTE